MKTPTQHDGRYFSLLSVFFLPFGAGSGGVVRRGDSGVERGQKMHLQAKENRKDGETVDGNKKVLVPMHMVCIC